MADITLGISNFIHINFTNPKKTMKKRNIFKTAFPMTAALYCGADGSCAECQRSGLNATNGYSYVAGQDIPNGGAVGGGYAPIVSSCGGGNGGPVTQPTQVANYQTEKFKTLRFNANITSDLITSVYLPDTTGIAEWRGETPDATSQPFVFSNGMPLDSWNKWLQTNAIAVCGYNLSSNVPANLGNLINVNRYSLDGTIANTQQIDNSINQNPVNPNTGLTVSNCGWIHMFNSAMFVQVDSTGATDDTPVTMQLTLKVAKAIPYTGEAWSRMNLPICTNDGCAV